MEKEPELKIVAVKGLELALRPANMQDIGFCYELMRNSLESDFNLYTSEGWSREKFKQGYRPERITILEHEGMPVGFYDLEVTPEYAYIHNVHISGDYQEKIGLFAITNPIREAKKQGVPYIKAKTFMDKEKLVRVLERRFGWVIKAQIPEENSYLLMFDFTGGANGK